MKAFKLSAAAALALAIAGCGGGTDSAGNTTAQQNFKIEQVAAPNGGDWTQMVSQTPQGGFIMGNPDAKVKLVEFGSMTCGACGAFSEEGVPQLTEKYVKSGQVSFEFRNFVRDGADMAAALVARCNGPSAFFPLTDQLFAAQEDWLGNLQKMTPEQQQQLNALSPAESTASLAQAAGLVDFARLRGIPAARAQACLADQAQVQRLVEINQTAVREYQVPGTPAFVINNRLVEAANWAQLEPAIQQALR
ncbi:MAG TPA: thioredoxin domain-containing protein [Allosphingosinicella sp.]|nr:thioredoxin domain-containing protein [Allosphingosinicella sp.]